jgi:AcrR family transcriptional regulator
MTKATVKKARRPSSRQAILDAAFDLIAEIGANHLTLDAVAARAGISKGGLLYNFPSKQALLIGLVEEAVAEVTALLETKADEDDLPAIIQRVFDARLTWLLNTGKSGTAHGMLAAMVEHPAMLEPVRRVQAMMWDRVKATAGDAPGVWLMWLAIEGLLCGQLCQVSPLSPAERQAVLGRLTSEVKRMVKG